MLSPIFFIVGVTLGAALLLAVVWRYLRGPSDATTVSITLAVLGFALVGSPLWANIVVKSNTVELSLLRDCQQQAAQSADETAKLLDVVREQAPPAKAEQLQPLVNQAHRSVEQLKLPETQAPEEHAKRLREAVGMLSEAVRAATSAMKNQ